MGGYFGSGSEDSFVRTSPGTDWLELAEAMIGKAE
jgi:hypothetical protein